jgi:heat-inducible transcriptional repressor
VAGPKLTPRQERILFVVAREFIAHGEAMSSAAVVRRGKLDVSSATVRNAMGELEALGMLEQPHTSAGRVPTERAMRAYVDWLRARQMRSPLTEEALRARLYPGAGSSLEQVGRASGALLSEVARLTSIVALPELDASRLSDIHLSGRRDGHVVVLLVTDDGRVYHREVVMERPVEPHVLLRMQNYLSELVLGLTLSEVRARVRLELERLERAYNAMVRDALELGRAALEVARPDVLVEGKLRLFEHAEFSGDVERLAELMGLLEEKERVLGLLDELMHQRAGEALVLIGSEIGWADAGDLSLVVCSYQRGGATGALGLIGPTRLDYGSVIPLVEQTARALSE